MMLSPDKLLAFCNRVREAGGAEPLTELLPGYLQSPEACLIARNLNFECSVIPMCFGRGREYCWVMKSDDPRLTDIANALGLPIEKPFASIYQLHIRLPDVAESARAFDNAAYPKELYAEENHDD